VLIGGQVGKQLNCRGLKPKAQPSAQPFDQTNITMLSCGTIAAGKRIMNVAAMLTPPPDIDGGSIERVKTGNTRCN
jgi:hypothetical protein